MYSDHYHPVADWSKIDWSQSVNTSPCYHEGFRFHDGQLSITGQQIGDAVRLQNRYTVRASVAQTWGRFIPDQAMYVTREVARQHNLRAYFVGASSPPWLESAFVYDDFKPPHAVGDCDITAGCFFYQPLSYLVLVWNIGGVDVGVAIHRADGSPFQGGIALAKDGACLDTTDDRCGNISWHTYVADAPLSMAVGDRASYSMTYDVGLESQLSALGYGWW
jgi:hypothetical protein